MINDNALLTNGYSTQLCYSLCGVLRYVNSLKKVL